MYHIQKLTLKIKTRHSRFGVWQLNEGGGGIHQEIRSGYLFVSIKWVIELYNIWINADDLKSYTLRWLILDKLVAVFNYPEAIKFKFQKRI